MGIGDLTRIPFTNNYWVLFIWISNIALIVNFQATNVQERLRMQYINLCEGGHFDLFWSCLTFVQIFNFKAAVVLYMPLSLFISKSLVCIFFFFLTKTYSCCFIDWGLLKSSSYCIYLVFINFAHINSWFSVAYLRVY